MWRDPIVEEVDAIRRKLLDQHNGVLDSVVKWLASNSPGQSRRVTSLAELNRLFPAGGVDREAIRSLGQPWTDPIVVEVRRSRRLLSEKATTPIRRKAKSA